MHSEHVPVTPGPGKTRYRSNDRYRYPVLGDLFHRSHWVNRVVTTPGTPITPGSTVTPSESVRPVNTGQKAQLKKADQCLAQSELLVLNSPDRSVQLEHNVHEPLGNMPTWQIEHLSEHSQVFQDFTNSDSPYVRADESPERTHLRHSGHRS